MSADEEAVGKFVVLGLCFVVYTLIIAVVVAKLPWFGAGVVIFFTTPCYMALLGAVLDPKGRRK